jgi:phospholipase/carboxylesterase
MNRIQNLFDDLGAGPDLFAAATAEAHDEYRFAETGGVALFCPLHYEPNYAYPLLVWLHGPRGDERQLQEIMPLVSLRNYVAVAPRGVVSCGPRIGGFTWSQADAQIRVAEERVLAAVAAARERFNVAPSRIFLAGFDCGGTMALRVGCSHPERFAGILSICGEFPLGNAPLSRLTEARRLPLLLATARDSGQYPPERACENLRLLYAAGMSIHLRQYPVGHELTTRMLSDMDRWIMEQINSPTIITGDRTDGATRNL